MSDTIAEQVVVGDGQSSGEGIWAMPVSQFLRPARCLEPFVRFYVQRDIRILRATAVHPVPARPPPMIVFDFNDLTDILHYAHGVVVPPPPQSL